ncbi:MAG: ATP-grasp domain-containing protein [Gemmatimonadetes bacterium]|nr:ATP-grasp domain-containing protein [Gemmatimonadota bacterium]
MGSESVNSKRVLLVGYRKPVAAVLERRGIPFAVWHEKPFKREPRCLAAVTAPFPRSKPAIRAFIEAHFAPLGPFTDVIAGTESSVLPASVSRRALGARRSKDATIIRCHDKLLMKDELSRHGIPMTDYLPGDTELSPRAVIERLGRPVVLKDPRNSGGRGMVMVGSAEELGALERRRALYERFVDAPEMSVESFIRNGRVVFTNCTGYHVKRCANVIPAPIPAGTRKEVLRVNAAVIEALKTSWGMAHTEFYLTERGVLFGEIALRPPGGYIMECMTLAHGFDAWDAFVAGELDLPWEWSQWPDEPRGHAASVVLHAGEGRLESVHGIDEVRADPACVKLRMLTAPGELVHAREGAGDSTAYALFRADTGRAVREAVDRCLRLVRFELA